MLGASAFVGALAQPIEWGDSVSGDWSVGPLWDGGVAPGTGDTAVIGAEGSPYTVSNTGDLDLGRLEVGSPDALLRLEDGVVTVGGGIDVADGAELEIRSATIANTTLSGGGTIRAVAAPGNSNSNVFDNVTLARGTSVVAENWPLRVRNQLALDSSQITVTTPLVNSFNPGIVFEQGASLAGDGGLTLNGARNTTFTHLSDLVLPTGFTLTTTGVDGEFSRSSIGSSGRTLTNQGHITIGEHSDVTISSRLMNPGSLVVLPDATLFLSGNNVATDLVNIFNLGGEIAVGGQLDNTGNTIDLSEWRLDGDVTGGMIEVSDPATAKLARGSWTDVVLASDIRGGLSLFSNDLAVNGTLDLNGFDLVTGPIDRLLGHADLVGPGRLINGTYFNGIPTTLAINGTIGPDVVWTHGEPTSPDDLVRVLASGFDLRGLLRIDLPTAVYEFDNGWQNNGVIELTRGTLVLGGEYAAEDLNTIQRGAPADSTLLLRGRMSLANQDFILTPEIGPVISDSVSFANGRLVIAEGGQLDIRETGLNLDAVTLAGDLVVPEKVNIQVTNGLTLDGATIRLQNGTGPFFNEVTSLEIIGPQTIDGNGEIVFVGGEFGNAIRVFNEGGLTIGSGVTVTSDSAGAQGTIGLSDIVQMRIDGQILADHAGDHFRVFGQIDNTGLIRAGAGARVELDQVVANSGQIVVDDGGQLQGFFTGSVGNLLVAPGGSVALLGASQVDQPLSVTDATLTVGPDVVITAPLSVNQGLLRIQSGELTPGQIVNTIGRVDQADSDVHVAGQVISASGLWMLPADVSLGIEGSSRFENGTIRSAGAELVVTPWRGVGVVAPNEDSVLFNAVNLDAPIRVTDGGTLLLNGNWSNQGSITLDPGGRLRLSGDYTAADLATLNGGDGVIELGSRLDNTDAVLETHGLGGNWILRFVDVTGGTFDAAAESNVRVEWDVRFDGTTLRGVMTSGNSNAAVRLTNGARLDGLNLIAEAPAGPPSNLSGRIDVVLDGQDLIGAGRLSTSGPDAELSISSFSTTAPLRIDSGIEIVADTGRLGINAFSGLVENAGSIRAGKTTTPAVISSRNLHNTGLIQLTNSAVLNLDFPRQRGNLGVIINEGDLDLNRASLRYESIGDLDNRTTGTITGSGIIDLMQGRFINNGTVRPGRDLSALGSGPTNGDQGFFFFGDVFLAGGVLDLSEFDRDALIAEGVARVITADSVSGTFDTITGQANPDGTSLYVVYQNNAVLIRQALQGDTNFDGFVSQADLNTVLLNWGSIGVGWAEGDFDGNGAVTQADLNTLLLNWGDSAPPAVTAIPEPTTLLALGVLGLTSLSRRRCALKKTGVLPEKPRSQ
ncbi:MAG: PEP-CTERM sorting domain-containing protein [Planctomycetota bacterium]